MPPACPVDRLMLTHAKAPYGLRTWTSTNDVARYRQQLECLRTAANGKDLAVWELVEFNRIAVFRGPNPGVNLTAPREVFSGQVWA